MTNLFSYLFILWIVFCETVTYFCAYKHCMQAEQWRTKLSQAEEEKVALSKQLQEAREVHDS